MLELIAPELKASAPISSGRRRGAVTGFLRNTERAAGGLPLRAMPDWLRPIVGWLMPRIGPKGLEFARARVEMKAIETVLHLRRAHLRRMRAMVPDHVWRLVAPYGLTPGPGERRRDDGGPGAS
jgi:coenzyme F420 hydrogenase subunit beta